MKFVLLLCLGTLAACQPESSNCSAVPSAVGTWRYSAAQATPVRASITGTLVFGVISCEAVTGQIDVIVTDAAGGTRRLAGPITGEVIDGKSLQFNAYVEATPWQHVGSFVGDSLSGSWVSAVSGQTETAVFGGRRQ